jgi:polysaccharide deacetylase family sporulation protein PdaB
MKVPVSIKAITLLLVCTNLASTGCSMQATEEAKEVSQAAQQEPGDKLKELAPATGVRPPLTPGGHASTAPNKLSGAAALARLASERDAYFVNAQKEDYKSVREVLAQHLDELDRGLKYSKFLKGKAQPKQIALTFDDGPHPTYTPKILAILKQYKVPATFFLVGSQAEKYPDLVRAEAAAGHNIANHTYHHVSLPKIPQEYVSDEIKACGMVLKAITGKSPHLFRPPGGEYNKQVAEASEALGYTMILWTDDPGDYASPGKDIILSRTLNKATPGGVILIHDGIQQTIDILPQMIETLQKQGYEFVTIDQMLKSGRGDIAEEVDRS